MHKTMIALMLLLVLAACAPSESAVQTAIAQTQLSQPTTAASATERVKPTLTRQPTKTRLPTRTPRPTNTPKPSPTMTFTVTPIGPADGFALNYLGEQESGGVKIEIVRVLIANKSALPDLSFEGELFNDKSVVGEVIFRVTNNTDKVVKLYVDQGILSVNSEQIDLFDYALDGADFGDDLGGEFLPGSISIGGIWFGLARTEVADVTKMIIKINHPSDDDYNNLGPDYFIELDLSEHIWEQLPKEF